jgi:hypothetical protein
MKSISKNLSKPRALFLIFLICAGIMLVYNLLIGFQFQRFFLLIGAVGFINGFGSYCHLRAYDYSLSQTVMFFPLSAVVTMGLAAAILGEGKIYNLQLIIGVILLLIGTAIFGREAGKKEEEEEKTKGKKRKGTRFRWLFFTLATVFIWGTAFFMVKNFSLDVSKGTFLLYWYIGASLSSLSLLVLRVETKEEKEKKLLQKRYLIVFGVAGILASMTTIYWVYQLGAATGIVEPVRRFCMSIIPIFIGFHVWKESKGLTKIQLLSFVIGIIGIVLVVLEIY